MDVVGLVVANVFRGVVASDTLYTIFSVGRTFLLMSM